MLSTFAVVAPLVALIDDDEHSARLLHKTLTAQGDLAVQHLGGGTIGGERLHALLQAPASSWPDLVVVDLKANSRANTEFAEQHHAMLDAKGIPLVVMCRPIPRKDREVLHRAGASGVFFRQPERDAYRREAAGLLNFLARQPRPDMVGM